MNPKIFCQQLCFALILIALLPLQLNAENEAKTTLEPVLLVNSKPIKFIDEINVNVSNIRYHLDYQEKGEKYKNSFIIIRNCNDVTIDNLHIAQLNANYLAHFSVIIEDCKRVIIKNSSFEGTCRYHIRIEGCEQITIENVTISGRDYGKKGIRCGGGIWINNGETHDGKNGLWSPDPQNLKNLTINNCTIKNNLAADKNRNQDGILIHSASNGTLSNCQFLNWLKGDAALDVSHRRTDQQYSNKRFSIEKCVFINNKHVKSTGKSVASNSIDWINNIYNDTKIGNYHQGWKDSRFFETYNFTDSTFGFWRNWSKLKGPIQIKGCLFHIQSGVISEMYKLSDTTELKAAEHIEADYNLYSMPRAPTAWLRQAGSNESSPILIYNDWKTWQASGKDLNSQLLIASERVKIHKENNLLIPIFTGLKLMPQQGNLQIPEEDFYGNTRLKFCYGAVCSASN